MKKYFILLMILAACAPAQIIKHDEMEMNQIMRIHSGTDKTVELHGYSVTFEPEHLEAGKEAHLEFKFDKPVELQESHGALMHIIVVSRDLEQFYHLHPEESETSMDSHHAFEKAGEYKVWIDFIANDMNHIIDFDFEVTE